MRTTSPVLIAPEGAPGGDFSDDAQVRRHRPHPSPGAASRPSPSRRRTGYAAPVRRDHATVGAASAPIVRCRAVWRASSTRCSASATRSSDDALILCLVSQSCHQIFKKPMPFDPHVALCGLHHVVDCQAERRRERSTPPSRRRSARNLHGRAHDQAGQLLVRLDIDENLRDRQRVAEADAQVHAFSLRP